MTSRPPGIEPPAKISRMSCFIDSKNVIQIAVINAVLLRKDNQHVCLERTINMYVYNQHEYLNAYNIFSDFDIDKLLSETF